MAYILCLETATTNCSVALAKDKECVALREFDSPKYSHAEQLHAFIKEVLEEAKITFKELEAVAISKGPGSYTGLRIGVSAAKGICFAMDIPLISIPTLYSLAKQVTVAPNDLIISMLDARRMEVYTQTFDATHQAVSETEALVLDETSFKNLTKENQVHLIGNGVAKFQEIAVNENFHFYPDAVVSAKDMIELSYNKFQQKNFEDVAYFEPFYLKDFVAGKPKPRGW